MTCEIHGGPRPVNAGKRAAALEERAALRRQLVAWLDYYADLHAATAAVEEEEASWLRWEQWLAEAEQAGRRA